MQAAQLGLGIWTWAVIGALFYFLWRIAYFYEKTSGQRVGYSQLIVAALLLIGGAVWYLARDVDFVGECVGDSLLIVGGLLFVLFGLRLQELMTGERR